MGVLRLNSDSAEFGRDTPWWGEYLAQYKQASRYVRGMRVLDIGCGRGFGSRFLFDNGAVSVTGIDLSSSDILKAQEVYGRDGVGFVVADVKNLPFAPKTFDMITCFQVIERIPSIDQALQQVARVLAPNGVALISTVNRKRFSELTEAPVEREHIQEYDYEEVKQLLKRSFSTFDIQGLFCTRLMGPDLLAGGNKTLEFLRNRFENHIPWKLRDVVAKKVFGVSYYPDETEYVLRSIGVQEASIFYSVCRK
ncbi:MAG: class I SAM-dependent methyltransferase [Oligoflexia bacterium]|nr:class I SAM-dependent methyltransferase [Oligoflexia bacterium]